MSADTLELRYVPLETLRRWDRNAKRHDLGALAASIARHGFRDPPAYDAALNGGEGGVVEGNGRGDALSAMLAEGRPVPRGIVAEGGTWLVPVLFGVDAPSQAAAEAYGVAHNQLTLAGGDFTALDMASLWEPAGYAALLEDLARQGEIPVGLDGEDVDALLRELAGVEPGAGGDEFDATPADGPTRAQSGDLWIIGGGRHRLIVGDSTDPEVVARLMGGDKPLLMVTDPPYGVEYDPTWRAEAGISKNTMRMGLVSNDDRADWTEAYRLFGAQVIYVWHGHHFSGEVKQSIEAAGYVPINPIVWCKDKFALSRGDYHWQHEALWYAVRKGSTHNWQGARDQSTVWHIKREDVSDGEWGHGTQKPLECMQRPIENNSQRGDLVVDPFLGSGTTLIAAHRTGRRCYGVEIEPRYADVILRRAEAEGLTVARADRSIAEGA
jgi:DNA modification methylase